jgi:NAD(P)H-hydrate repair Nnr-like enzyme with NAD(P)H-hydrate dehydratase domain
MDGIDDVGCFELHSLMNQQPELMVHNARIIPPKIVIQTLSPDVIAIGPGLGQSDLAQEWLIAALQWIGPLIIDADGRELVGQPT